MITMPDLGFKVVALSVVAVGLVSLAVLADPELPAKAMGYVSDWYNARVYRAPAANLEITLYQDRIR